MPGNNTGFGHGFFGHFPFGHVEWAKRVLTDVVPEVHISRDNEQAARPLQTFLEVCREVVEGVRTKNDDFLDLRDPLVVPFGLIPSTFGQAKVDDQILTVSRKLSGQMTFTNGSNVVTGVGTAFTQELIQGLAISPDVASPRSRVATIVSDTSLTMADAWIGPTVTTDDGAGLVVVDRGVVTYVSRFTAPLASELPEPASFTTLDTRIVVSLRVIEGQTPVRADYIILDSTQIEQLSWIQIRDTTMAVGLGSDFGISIDDRDDEAVSRSAIANVTQFIPLKGTIKGYDVIGKIYGYDTTVLPLWHVDVSKYDPSYLATHGELFEYPSAGSGVWLTSVAPRFLSYDEVPSDVEPTDIFCDDELMLVTFPTTVSGFTSSTVTLTGNTDIVLTGWILVCGDDRFQLETTVTPGVFEWNPFVNGTTPTAGAAVLEPPCHLVEDCDFCKTSKLFVAITPRTITQGTSTTVDRIIERYGEVKPIHVELVRLAFRVNLLVTLNLSVTIENTATLASFINGGHYFDFEAADDLPTDGPLAVTGEATELP